LYFHQHVGPQQVRTAFTRSVTTIDLSICVTMTMNWLCIVLWSAKEVKEARHLARLRLKTACSCMRPVNESCSVLFNACLIFTLTLQYKTKDYSHSRMPRKEQTNLAPSDNEFPSQLFFVAVVGNIAIAIVVVASHVPHFTAVSTVTFTTHW
jgi:hypothetical protein